LPIRPVIPLILLAISISACHGGHTYVPVFGAGETRREGVSFYVVKRGDTVYSIAFRYGLDYRELADYNNIRSPYTIYVDQRIRLPRKVEAKSAPSPATPPPTPATQTAEVKQPAKPAERVTDAGIEWRWPYEGEVVNPFSLDGKINKGIDIRGKTGDAVRSTADGVVVYAGGGLRGYGKLVIVKHNARFLSAYGHNRTILVKEGDRVKAGQAVAKIGGNTGSEELLHFEIRRNGKPEDPLRYLPPRGS